ncbi:MAG: putative Ig domain-containing protein [Candidatus Thiodiazotropha sp. (ex Epidulcina cf. delphinae)]|nr:putative Ig domain-containing protein [Candidatus Thiodiazotropha sp. (ex Epidulcina cf. delphinae)]
MSFKRYLKQVTFALFATFAVLTTAEAALSPVAADVIVVIDESGSMSGEQRWVAEVIPLLEQDLLAYGIGNESQANQYGLVGYTYRPRSLLLDGELLGDDQAFVASSGGLRTSGGTEDGWRAIEYALEQYPRRNGAAVNIILATDEDRDNTNSAITFQTILAKLEDNNALLNAVVNARIQCGDGSPALGMDSTGSGYIADGSGGFSTCEGATATTGSGSTVAHYVELAVQNGGAVWDLSFLRSGGHYAESFTNALLTIKVDEILNQRPIGDLVAVAQATPNPAVAGQSVMLDGTQSFHQLDNRQIVSWEWDLDNDGVYDVSGPVVTTSFPQLGQYPIALRVIDDSDTPVVDIAEITVDINIPPLKPTAVSGGPYLFCPQNTPWRLDGGQSVNPDDGVSELGSPQDAIIDYAWDLNNDLNYSDANGAVVDVTSQMQVLGVGDHLIRLRVTDNTVNAFPSSGLGNLLDISVSQVSIRDQSDILCNCLPDLAARPKATKVQLTWTDTGVYQYAVYRSQIEGGPYHEIAVTDNRYSTYLDLGLELDTTYYYVVAERGANGRDICRSREVAVTPTARRIDRRNLPPAFTSTPVTEATEGVTYSYDSEAIDPNPRDSVSYGLVVAPTGMTIDGGTGLIEWTPINAQVGQHVITVQASDRQAAYSEQTFVITVTNVNQAPVITSFPVTTASENVVYGYTVQAIDPDVGDQLAFALTLAPDGMSVNAQTGEINWIPQASHIGTHPVEISVTDLAGTVASQSFSIEVTEQNLPPSIITTPNNQATEGVAYQYDVNAIDPNVGDTITYALGQFPEDMVIEPINGLITWIPRHDQIGIHAVSVIVSDSSNASTTQSYRITVSELNVAPVITTVSLPAATEDVGYAATVEATDSNAGDTISYSIESGPSGLAIDTATGQINWLPLNDHVGDNSVVVRATDTGGLFSEATLTIAVLGVNDAPSITSAPITTAQSQAAYQYQVAAQDADVGDTLTFALQQGPQGMTISATGLVEWLPPSNAAATYPVEISVTDSAGASVNQSYTLTVTNRDPQITSTPVAHVVEGGNYQYQIVASDADGDTLSYTVTTAPAGMTINTAAGLIAWTPTDTQLGSHTVSVQVDDGRGGTASQNFTLTVDPAPNTAPTITSTPVTTATEGVAYSYDVNATDADGDTLSYSLTTAPAGVTIDGTSGLIAWTPSNAQLGSQAVSVQVDDGNGGSATQSFTVTVSTTPNTAPTITSTPVTTATEGVAYSYDVNATDADGDTLSYSLTTAPAGVTIDGTSGLIAWTPSNAQLGSQAVSVQVDDGNGGSATQSFTVTVSTTPNTAPTITSTPVTTATEGVAYSYDVNATDADGDTLSYSLTTAPAGVTIDGTSGLIAWTPSAAQVGSHAITVQVDDSNGGTATQSYSVTVESAVGNQIPSITSTPNTQATVNGAYTYAVAANDPDGDALSYSLTTAPAGMAIDSVSGVINWTPDATQIGSHTVTLRVDDGQAYVEQSFAISVGSDALPLNVFISLSSQIVDLGGSTTVTVISEGGLQPASLTLDVDGTPIALDGAGQATLPASAIGAHHLTATASDTRETVDARSYYSVRDPADTVTPTAIISTPATDSELTAPVEVIGTANDANLAEYKLLVSPADLNQYTEIAFGATAVIDGVLGTFDPTQLDNGIYDVALIVTDVNGLQSSTVVQYQVTGDMKVGNFSFTVEDLSIPVAGIPITINRTYDTRKRFRDLDFGYGWTIDYQSVKVEENIKLGLNWTQTSSGGFFPSYCVDPVGAHVVTVTLPDGKVEAFDMGVTPHCNTLIPLQFVDPVFTARAGTTSTLVVEDVGQLWYSGGTLLDPGFFDTYDPSRYTLTTAEGYVYALDQNFGIRTVTDPNGNTLTYSSNGIVHSSGKSVTFARDGQGRITRITDPNGNVIDYAYNVNGDLASVTNQVGEVTQHRYNRSHGLTEYIDPRGITPARNIYNDEGQLIATEDADGNRIEMTHDVVGRQEIVRDRLGNVTVLGYDDNGYVTAETDALGNTTSYARDERGNELSKTDALGNTVSKTFDVNDNPLTETDALGNTITRSYNARNQLLTSTDKNGNVTSNVYDTQGNLTQVTDPLGNVRNDSFDSAGNLTSMTDEGGHTRAFTYDTSGNKVSETDSLGNVASFQYDANGNQTGDSRTRTDGGAPVTVTTQKVYDAANRLITDVDGEGYSAGTDYNSLGKVSAEIDKNGSRTEFDYDSRGNLIRTRYADGTQSSATYDTEGNKVSETDQAGNTTSYEYDALKHVVRTTYADGSQVSNGYDAVGRLATVTDAHGNITSNEYDAAGQRTRVTDPLGNQTSYTYDANGNQTGVTDANGHTTLYEYDSLNSRIRTIFPDGSQINLSYDTLGRKIAETDQAGVTTQYAYDALGRLILVTDALGGQTSYTYDEFGNKLTQTDAEGRTTSWTYDNVGNVLSRTLSLGQTETFTYDGNGNKLTQTDFNGNTITYSYDSLNRLVLKTYPDASTVAYSYTAMGKIGTVTDTNGITSNGYDARDRLIRVDNPDGSFIAYAYDAMGNRAELTTQVGTTFYTYDALNRLESITDLNGGVTVYSYDAVGNRSSVSYPNGTLTNYSYDSLNRLTSLENLRSDSTVVSSYQYTLGPAGNRIRIVEDTGRTVDYVYDSLYRLISESVTDLINGNSQVDYAYDAVGNRLTKTVDGLVTLNYSYDANDRLLSEGTTSYTYDANGNTLTKNDGSLTTYGYDADNRLVQVQSVTQILGYGYDADGIRRSVSVNGVVTRHLVDKNRDYAQVIEERNAANNLQVAYTYGDDLISQDSGGSTSYYHYDGLGSTRALTDNSELATDTYTYEAFGSLIRSTGTTPNSYLYTGEQFDPNTGFYYLRARYMNPENGRFLSTDPFSGLMHEPITLHKYLYAGLDPLSNTDPSGEFFGGFSFGGFGLSLSIGLRLYASNALFYGAPMLYLVQRVLMRVNVAFLTRLVNLATARFYQSAQSVLINSNRILRLDAGRAFEKLVNPAMRLIGAVRHRPIPGAIPDWIFRGRHIIDAKLGQSVNIGQLRHFVNWTSQRGGNVVYITLTRTPPSIVRRARDIGGARGVVVNFISLTPF